MTPALITTTVSSGGLSWRIGNGWTRAERERQERLASPEA
jgi:hypothetical protein